MHTFDHAHRVFTLCEQSAYQDGVARHRGSQHFLQFVVGEALNYPAQRVVGCSKPWTDLIGMPASTDGGRA